ncbi:MAG: YraN family protein [bacterium]|nr:YraN family protein [bacterium]
MSLIVSRETWLLRKQVGKTGKAKAKIGALGEQIAARFLEGKGFSVIGRNYWQKWGEIDLIAEDRAALRFVEVKTMERTEGESFLPEENVHKEKLKRLFRTIHTYLDDKREGEREWQLDVVAVIIDFKEKTASVRFTENVLPE